MKAVAFWIYSISLNQVLNRPLVSEAVCMQADTDKLAWVRRKAGLASGLR